MLVVSGAIHHNGDLGNLIFWHRGRIGRQSNILTRAIVEGRVQRYGLRNAASNRNDPMPRNYNCNVIAAKRRADRGEIVVRTYAGLAMKGRGHIRENPQRPR